MTSKGALDLDITPTLKNITFVLLHFASNSEPPHYGRLQLIELRNQNIACVEKNAHGTVQQSTRSCPSSLLVDVLPQLSGASPRAPFLFPESCLCSQALIFSWLAQKSGNGGPSKKFICSTAITYVKWTNLSVVRGHFATLFLF